MSSTHLDQSSHLSLSPSPPPPATTPPPPISDPPPFSSFVHLLSTSISDLTSLVSTLYTTALFSTDLNTKQSAINLLTDHVALQQQLRAAEQKCLGKWSLFSPPPTVQPSSSSTSSSSSPRDDGAEQQMLGTLTVNSLSASFVSGSLSFSLAQQYRLVSRSHHQQNSKLDSHGNLHLSFTVSLTPSRALQHEQPAGGDSRRMEGVLDLMVSGDGERMKGDFLLSDEQTAGDDIEGDITAFIGVRADNKR
jgi:hypothetical protein